MSNSLWPHGLYSPWNSPGQNTGVGSRSLLQGIFPTQGLNPDLPHCRWFLYHLSYQGSPINIFMHTSICSIFNFFFLCFEMHFFHFFLSNHLNIFILWQLFLNAVYLQQSYFTWNLLLSALYWLYKLPKVQVYIFKKWLRMVLLNCNMGFCKTYCLLC